MLTRRFLRLFGSVITALIPPGGHGAKVERVFIIGILSHD
jgi:hypothetical protein